jgi:hypothetical protein
VLSRGLITLNHLKVVGALCLFVQLGTALAADRGFGRITLAWSITIVYALLMLKEFFIADWLKARLLPYALSHMVVSPLSMVWFYLIGAGDAPLGSELLWLSLLAYASAAGFEVARKTRGPEEERPSVDSYSQRMGVPLAMLLLVFVHAVAFFATFMLLRDLSASTTMVLVTAGFFLPLLASIAAFVRAPSAKGRKSNEGLTALSLVFCHLAPVITLLSQRGYSW